MVDDWTGRAREVSGFLFTRVWERGFHFGGPLGYFRCLDLEWCKRRVRDRGGIYGSRSGFHRCAQQGPTGLDQWGPVAALNPAQSRPWQPEFLRESLQMSRTALSLTPSDPPQTSPDNILHANPENPKYPRRIASSKININTTNTVSARDLRPPHRGPLTQPSLASSQPRTRNAPFPGACAIPRPTTPTAADPPLALSRNAPQRDLAAPCASWRTARPS